MTAATTITTYLGSGTLANRPASPAVPVGGLGIYYATDTTTLYQYPYGGTWSAVSGGGGGGTTYPMLGFYDSAGTQSPGSGNLLLARVMTPANGFSLTSIHVFSLSSRTPSLTPCVYAANPSASYNSSGAILATGPTITSVSPGVVNMPLSSALALSANTLYWIGFLIQTSGIDIFSSPVANAGYASTTATTPPSTGPGFNVGNGYQIWGSSI